MAVPRDIERRMDKVRAKREAKNAKAIAAATKEEIKGETNPKPGTLLLVVACLALLAGCGQLNSPLTPTTAATTVAVPVPGGVS